MINAGEELDEWGKLEGSNVWVGTNFTSHNPFSVYFFSEYVSLQLIFVTKLLFICKFQI